MIPADIRDSERRLLSEIGAIADRTRELRRSDAVRHQAEIKLLAGDLHEKWQAIRKLRAPAVAGDVTWTSRRGSRE